MVATVTGLLLSPFGLQAADPDITVKPLVNSEYELTLRTSTSIDVLLAQRMLLPTAKSTCGTEPVEFENYDFEFSAPIGDANPATPQPQRVTQTIRCGYQSASIIPQVTDVPDGWKPTAGDQAMVETQTYRFLAAKAAGDYTTAYRMLSESMKAVTHRETWQSQGQAFNAGAGKVLSRHVVKLTWYKDPPSAPRPGIYVAADYTGKFTNVPIFCGYVAWYREASGVYTVIHEKQNSINKDSIATMKAEDVQALVARFGCPVSGASTKRPTK